MIKKKFSALTIFFITFLMLSVMNIPVSAVYGNATITADRYAEFYLDVEEPSSIQARVNVTTWNVPSNGVIITVQKPNGQTCLADSGTWWIYNNGTMYFNFINAPAGKYKITINPMTTGVWFSMNFEIINR